MELSPSNAHFCLKDALETPHTPDSKRVFDTAYSVLPNTLMPAPHAQLKRPFTVALVLFGLSGCELIQDQLDGNQAPVISTLVPDSAEGDAPLLVGFSWEVADIKVDTLTHVFLQQRRKTTNRQLW